MSAPDLDSDCEFCAIARGDDRSVEVVCEGESWLAFFPSQSRYPRTTLSSSLGCTSPTSGRSTRRLAPT